MKKIILVFLFLFATQIAGAQIPVLWGVTQFGGANDIGTIIKINGNGNGFDTVHSFNAETGDSSAGSLFQASNGLLYGMTVTGGTDFGVIFSFDPTNNTYIDVHDFDGTHGARPFGSLIQLVSGKLYGLTSVGGSNYAGVIFSFDPSGNSYSDLYDFSDTSFDIPFGSLLASNDGKLYGMTWSKGESETGSGNIFCFNPSSGTYKNLHIFSSPTGLGPYGDLIQLSNGLLYGMTSSGGKNNDGVIFSMDTSGNNYTDLYDFKGVSNADGANPYGNLIQATNGKLYGMTFSGGLVDSGIIFWFDPSTNKYSDTTFYTFEVPKGAGPTGSLLQGSDGLLYGMTNQGGTNENGVIFSIDTAGKNFNDLHFFNYGDGSMPVGNLIQVGTVSGIPQLSAANNNEISIYPNPTSGEINIVSTKTVDDLKVFNLLGQLVYDSRPKQMQFTFELKDEGMYFVMVASDNGVSTSKIIVSK